MKFALTHMVTRITWSPVSHYLTIPTTAQHILLAILWLLSLPPRRRGRHLMLNFRKYS